jgi:hypothetical protein
MKVKLKHVASHRLAHFENCVGELEFLPNNVFTFKTSDRELTSTTITEIEEYDKHINIYTINSVFAFKKKDK